MCLSIDSRAGTTVHREKSHSFAIPSEIYQNVVNLCERLNFISHVLCLQDTPVGVNIVSLPDTHATAMLRDDGTVFLNYEVVSEVGIDMPRINYDRFNGRKYRYAFGCANQVSGEFMNSVSYGRTLIIHEIKRINVRHSSTSAGKNSLMDVFIETFSKRH